jgi:Flp pilus assembly protein TadG
MQYRHTGETTRRRERGQALLEFALIVPFLLVLILVIIDFGFAMDRRLVLQHAVREGARYAALSIDNEFICDRTVAQSQGALEYEDISLSYDDIDGNGTVTDAGDAINVTATYTWTFPFAREMLEAFGATPPEVDLGPTGSSRLERQHPSEFECPPP